MGNTATSFCTKIGSGMGTAVLGWILGIGGNLELKAVMLNIRPGHNPQLMEACSTLKEYSEFVEKVRGYTKTLELNMALDKAVTECIEEGILADVLRKNRAEVIKVSLYEYDQEQHMKWLREEGYEQGHEDGKEDTLVTNI